MVRMWILTTIEQDAFDKSPLFDHKERKQFLILPKGLMDVAKGLRTPESQIGFQLMCGYFKATKRFYQPQDFRDSNIAAAIRQLSLPDSTFGPPLYAETTRLRHQRQILDFYGFTPCAETAGNALVTEIATMARINLKPRLIFDRCVDFLFQNRVQVPSAWRLNDLIRAGLHDRKAGLIALMYRVTLPRCPETGTKFT